MRPEEKRALARAEAEFRRVVRERAGFRCEAPACPNRAAGRRAMTLEVAHIVPRDRARLRVDPANARLLCGEPCHRGPRGVDGGGWEWADLIGEAEYQRLRTVGMDPLWRRPPTWYRDQLAELTGAKT